MAEKKTKKRYVVLCGGDLDCWTKDEDRAAEYCDLCEERDLIEILAEMGTSLSEATDEDINRARYRYGQDGAYRYFEVSFEVDSNDESISVNVGDACGNCEISFQDLDEYNKLTRKKVKNLAQAIIDLRG